MNKITIPALLLGVVMIAGAFAFMPVQEASTVHTSGTITIADNSITAAKIAAGAITASEAPNLDQAITTTQTNIQNSQIVIQGESLAAKTQATPMTATITCNAAFAVLGAQVVTTHDNSLDNFDAPTLTVDGNAVPLTGTTNPAANADIAESITGSISSGALAASANENIVITVVNAAANGSDDTIAVDAQILTTTSAVCSVT